MKTISYVPKMALLFLLVLSGCGDMTIRTGDGSQKVTGNGKTTTETRDVTPFNAISVEGVFNVVIEQGKRESVKVEADDNIVPLIVTSVEHDTLKIKMKDNLSISRSGKLNVYVTFMNIISIETNGVGSLKCSNPLRLNELNMDLQGVGATELTLDVQTLNVKTNIVGMLTLSGAAKEVTINHNGVGMIEAFKLKAEKLALHSDAIGGAHVYASKEISVDANGVGGVEYKGGAMKKSIRNSGVGKVSCADCE